MKPILITGGSGFVGSNLAYHLLQSGQHVLLYDNLSRAGVEQNFHWLREQFGDRVQLEQADIRDRAALRRCASLVSHVYHFAAQVAVTTSLVDPVDDFEVNALGTLNVLEAIRAQAQPPSLIFTSTNKVYGGLEDVALRCRDQRYEPVDDDLRAQGISEARPLDFHSPYGCSKGTADQYVLDYSRSYGLDTVVFRMSCIYGPRQFGTEDQGWVAHFLIQALAGQPLTLYGDGMQVRDILFVEDLVRAMTTAQAHIHTLRGSAFNIGGGPDNTISLLNLLDMIRELTGREPNVSFDNWRTGDQRYYVSDTRKFSAATGWTPSVDAYRGVERLLKWIQDSSGVLTRRAAQPLTAGARA